MSRNHIKSRCEDCGNWKALVKFMRGQMPVPEICRGCLDSRTRKNDLPNWHPKGAILARDPERVGETKESILAASPMSGALEGCYRESCGSRRLGFAKRCGECLKMKGRERMFPLWHPKGTIPVDNPVRLK